MSKISKVVILGADGQLGRYLQKELRSDFEVKALGIKDYDLTADQTNNLELMRQLKPDFIVNCAAYTAVDQAESQKDLAFQINGESLIALSEITNQVDAKLIHISTDFVFDGQKNTPYQESDSCSPLSVYGESKLLGEQNIQKHCKRFSIFRTSWLYSTSHPCFVTSMLRLASEYDSLSIVYDQVGTPTSALSLCRAICTHMDQHKISNQLYHLSDQGVASWYDFATMIFKLKNIDVEVKPILTKDYPTPATRPKFSVLDKTKFLSLSGFKAEHWIEALEKTLLSQ